MTSAESQWRVAVDDKQSGPFSFDQLAKMIKQGRVPTEALVWKEGMNEWRRWTQLPEFTDLVGLAGPSPNDGSVGTMLVDILVFRRMVVPIIIQVVFWTGVVTCLIIGLVSFGLALREDSLAAAFGGLGFIIVGPLLVRIWCEFIIVGFRVSETLTDIKNQLKQSPSPS